MEIQENEGGGTSVVLVAGDDLNKVPRSHRRLLTAPLREAFADPPAYFGQIAKRCPFPQMSRWLRTLVKEGLWELQLHQGDPKEWTLAGFDWVSETVRGATITLPENPDLGQYPVDLQRYYSLVDIVNWMGFGCAGGLDGIEPRMALAAFSYDYHGDKVDPLETFVWGSSPCGDMLIYTSDGRAGWLCHENGHVHLLGTIAEAIDWVFSELLARRGPEYDYKWAKQC